MSLAVKKYSKALFEIAEAENCLDEIYEQFKAVDEQIIADKDFAKIVDTKILTAREKKDVFEKILAEANPYLLNFFRVLVDNDRTEELREIFAAFEEDYKDYKNILEATAVTAIALTPGELEDIKKTLSQKYSKTVYLDNKVDESIIGGMILYVGNTMLDASIRTKMNGLRDQMKQIKIS